MSERINDLTLYNFLKENLRVCYLTSDKKETFIRCPICGDSRRDVNKARFYIRNKPPYVFHCFNCESNGIIGDKIFESLELLQYGKAHEVLKYVKEQQASIVQSSNYKKKRKKITTLPYFNNELDFSYYSKDVYKLDYLNHRLNTQITEDNLYDLRIILNLEEFIKSNGLSYESIFPEMRKNQIKERMEKLKSYIGFLSMDRGIVIMRNTQPTEDKRNRFANLTLFHDDEDIMSFNKTYTVNSGINKHKPHHEVVLSEGPIDVLSIYLNLYYNSDIDLDDYLFFANGGKSYMNTLSTLTDYTLLDNTYHIYSDNDVSLEFFQRLKKFSNELSNNKAYLYYNTLHPDFGVSEIELSNRLII